MPTPSAVTPEGTFPWPVKWDEENRLTDVTGLEKLTQLKQLSLINNPDLTKAQIDELQKALPNCLIVHPVLNH